MDDQDGRGRRRSGEIGSRSATGKGTRLFGSNEHVAGSRWSLHSRPTLEFTKPLGAKTRDRVRVLHPCEELRDEHP